MDAELQKIISEFPPDPVQNDANSDKDLMKLQRKAKNLVEDWLEHYRVAIQIGSPSLQAMQDLPTARIRPVQSAKPREETVVGPADEVVISRAMTNPRVTSAPADEDFPNKIPVRVTDAERDEASDLDRNSIRISASREGVKFDDNPVEIQPEQLSEILISPLPVHNQDPLPRSANSRRAESYISQQPSPVPDPSQLALVGCCTNALRKTMMGDPKATCHCSKYKIPNIMDMEFADFTQKYAPECQLIIVAVVSNLFPDRMPVGLGMLEQLYTERNRTRTRPCMQAHRDPYRIFLYDMPTAADFSDHTEPLLLRRHNVVPGMFLIYQGGNLVFCNHIFNGYGNERRDFQKQIMESKRNSSAKNYLPSDFRFSPDHGRHGLRSAWGGTIGGSGVDNHGNPGLTKESGNIKSAGCNSVSSAEDNETDLDDNSRDRNGSFLPRLSQPPVYSVYMQGGIDSPRTTSIPAKSLPGLLSQVH